MGKMWGGVFNKNVEDSVLQYTSSINIDKLLAKFDIEYSIVHAMALEKAGLVSKQELNDIVRILKELSKNFEENNIKISEDIEDIHTFIENYLIEKLKNTAYKLHAGRSRNDQIMVSVRLYCKQDLELIIDKINKMIKAILKIADANKNIIIPAYTHLQHAQPVLFSHYLIAYINMFKRDIERLSEAVNRLDVLPAGSAACTGTSVNLDLDFIAKKLGFSKISDNSLDAVSDRDFIAEILSGLSILFMHFSRLAEDLILWYSQEFNIISIDESFCTGSSIMPHKKNPDALELIRGNSSKIYGNLFSILTLLKGLPLSYNRDLQLDKEFLFPSINTAVGTLDILIFLFDKVKINTESVDKLLKDEKLYITDVAEFLVYKGMPFREAHEVIGKVYKHCVENKMKFSDMSLSELKKFSGLFDDKVFSLFNPNKSVNSKVTLNSTNPDIVSRKISELLKEFK